MDIRGASYCDGADLRATNHGGVVNLRGASNSGGKNLGAAGHGEE